MRRNDPAERLEYLQNLVTEFQDTDSEEAKEQVLANLANFAFDPNNWTHLRELQVQDLFLDMLSEQNQNLVEFGIGGLCNLSMDPGCRDLILQSAGIRLVTEVLSNQREETVLSAVTTLMNLSSAPGPGRGQGPGLGPASDPSVLHCMMRFSLSESPRLRNLASVFLQDFCSPDQVVLARQQVQEGGRQTAVGIPLPEDQDS